MTSRTALLSAAAACRQQRNLRHLLSAAPFSSAAAPPLLRPSSPSPTSPAAAASPAPATGSSSAHCAASASPAGFPFVPSRLASCVEPHRTFSSSSSSSSGGAGGGARGAEGGVTGAGKSAVAEKDFSAADLVIQESTRPKEPLSLRALKFGSQFSEHMLLVPWRRQHGWSSPVIKPVAPLPLHPAAQVLHYGMGCFEGMKAFKSGSGIIRLFRPDKNMDRLASSCHRLNLPAFSTVELLECIKALLKVDEHYIPAAHGFAAYIRPTVIATTPFLGVGPPTDVLLYVLLSPVGPYFPSGLKPIRLLVDQEHARAFPGGVGDKKVAGNYAPTILPQVQAAHKGCSQVLYVLKDQEVAEGAGAEAGAGGGVAGAEDGEEDGLIGESGSMNVFFVVRKEGGAKHGTSGVELVTPSLDGMILPGVTRDSVLQLARAWGDMDVSERPIRLKEIRQAHKEGRLLEIFGTGTAVVVQPVSALVLPDGTELSTPVEDATLAHWTSKKPGQVWNKPEDWEPLSVAARVHRALMDIQYGLVEHPWSVKVE
ncbi:unnamed protein product [Closterium sp. NIES-64]|nr:unnamed protein product [Closterium sp. NIES-64]CAI5999899.1 unnamed protein product [Closterium sp. NIES-65]